MNQMVKTLIAIVLCISSMLSQGVLAQQVEVLWLGHGTVRITSTTGKVIMIDAFLKKNPQTPTQYKNLEALGKVDLILITHGHIDHVDDLEALARLTGATVVTNFELGNQLTEMGVLDPVKVIAINKGGMVTPIGRGIAVHMVPADHSSSLDLFVSTPPNFEAKLRHLDAGAAVGYVVELENGFTIYASGDTNVFGDMALINRFFTPDLALVCIGGYYTMGPEGAAYAMRELVKPKQVIPIHYGSYPVINRTPAEFKAALGDAPIEVVDVQPGEAVKF